MNKRSKPDADRKPDPEREDQIEDSIRSGPIVVFLDLCAVKKGAVEKVQNDNDVADLSRSYIPVSNTVAILLDVD